MNHRANIDRFRKHIESSERGALEDHDVLLALSDQLDLFYKDDSAARFVRPHLTVIGRSISAIREWS